MTEKALPNGGSVLQRLARLFKGGPRTPTAGPEEPAPLPAPNEAELNGLDDPRTAIRFGYRVILYGLGSFALWATLAPIGEGVTAPGVIVVESHRKVVSHLTGGTVATVKISENQKVKEGDVLLTLDDTRARATYYSLLGDYVSAAAKLSRLVAEQGFAARIEFPQEVIQYAEEIGRQDVLRTQEQLFRTRQQAMRSEQAILRENLSASQIQATGTRQQLSARRQQIALLEQEIQSSRPLVEAGYSPRNRLLEQERQLAELNSVASDLYARIAREGSSSAEIRLRLLQRQQEYLKEVETLVSEGRREVAGLEERLKDAKLELERTVVRAPVSGQVLALVAQAPGSVITPGTRLMEIVPDGDKLLLDVQVPVNVAYRVQPGMQTDIRITVFPETPSLIIDGRVLSISSDRHEPQGLPPYYLARIEVTPAGIARLEGRQLRPGMSADVVVKTGERSFLTYLMTPLTRRFFESFREP